MSTRRIQRLVKAWPLPVVVAFLANATTFQAQQPEVGQQPKRLVTLVGQGGRAILLLAIMPSKTEEEKRLFVTSDSPDACKFPERLFEMPVQMDGSSFLLKRVLRATQNKRPDGGCLETLATVYRPDDFRRLAASSSVVFHLPTGAVTLNEEALAYIKSEAPTSVASPQDIDPARFADAIDTLNGLIVQGRAADALQAAESIASLFASRPAAEALSFYATFGFARRVANDLDGAVVCYEIAVMIASASGNSSPGIGVIYDNLATVRRVQRRWEAADAASDRALALLEKAVGSEEVSYGHALNNRAILLAEEGDSTRALDYSERALRILRKGLKDDDEALQPFLEDNRLIKARLLKK